MSFLYAPLMFDRRTPSLMVHQLPPAKLVSRENTALTGLEKPSLKSETLITSCRSKYTDAARRTRSFRRNATLSVIAGNPPADGAHPLGMKGMIVTVARKVRHDPRAPRIPNFLFQNPANNNAPNPHSAIPKKYVAPRIPNREYIQKIKGPWLI